MLGFNWQRFILHVRWYVHDIFDVLSSPYYIFGTVCGLIVLFKLGHAFPRNFILVHLKAPLTCGTHGSCTFFAASWGASYPCHLVGQVDEATDLGLKTGNLTSEMHLLLIIAKFTRDGILGPDSLTAHTQTTSLGWAKFCLGQLGKSALFTLSPALQIYYWRRSSSWLRIVPSLIKLLFRIICALVIIVLVGSLNTVNLFSLTMTGVLRKYPLSLSRLSKHLLCL